MQSAHSNSTSVVYVGIYTGMHCTLTRMLKEDFLERFILHLYQRFSIILILYKAEEEALVKKKQDNEAGYIKSHNKRTQLVKITYQY